MDYDYEKENYKTCPVCQKEIDYHIHGFYHDRELNVWICRDHKFEEIKQHINLLDEKIIEFIRESEASYLCAACAGRQPLEPEGDDMFEIKSCVKCGALTAKELGGEKWKAQNL